MKQPINCIVFYDDPDSDPEKDGYWVDIESEQGNHCLAAISVGRTEMAAYRQAAKRLRKFANECDKRADKIKYG